MGAFVDLEGKKFGRLTVQKRSENRCDRVAWDCICECGNSKVVIGKSLVSGNTISCGCYNLEKSKKQKYRRYNKYNLDGEYGIGLTSKGEEFYFDLDDYNLIKNYSWHISSQGYVESYTTGVNIKFHRYLLNLKCDDDLADHKDGNKQDNRRRNLRIVDKQINSINTKIRTDNTSGTKGVSYNKSKGIWCAYINKNKKRYYLGNFISKDDAIKARELAELEMFCENSRIYYELKEKYNT